MKKNYVKLKIRNNKIILKEEGTKYGSAGKEAAGKLGGVFSDSLKMIKTTVQRAWGATFLYGYNIINSMRQDGIKGLHSANQQFHRDDSALQREQMQLIASQPGNKDAKLFIGMTCPAALAFDKYCDTDLSKFRDAAVKVTKDLMPDEKDVYDASVAYTNLVTTISHLSDNTPLNFIEVAYSKTDRKDVSILQVVKDNIKKDNFRAMCKYLQKFYKSNTEVETEDSSSNKTEDTFYIGKDMKDILEMLYKQTKKKEILKFIKEKGIATIIDSKGKKFTTEKARKKKIKGEFKEFVSSFKFESFDARISFKDKVMLLEEEETNKKVAIKKIDAQTGMSLSFSEYYLLGIDILTLLTEIQTQKNSAMIVSNEKLLETLSKKEDFDDNIENLLTKKIQDINNLVNEVNQKIPQLEIFDIKLEKADVTNIEKFTQNLKESLDMIQKSYDEIKDTSEDVKDLAYSQVMLDIIEKIKPEISDIDPDNLEDSFTSVITTINSFYKELEENFLEVCEKNNSKLLENKIDFKKIMNKKKDFISETNTVFKKLRDSFANIENFTGNENKLNSFVKEKKEEIENESDENNDAEEDSNNKDSFIESTFVKSEIVKILEK